MKIRTVVEQVTPAQWEWLLKSVQQKWIFVDGGVRVCVEFAHVDGLQHRHMEMTADGWTGVVRHLNTIATAEAVLTPDALPDDPGLKLGRIGTNAGHGHVWRRPDGVRARCGGPAMCGACKDDLKLFNAL